MLITYLVLFLSFESISYFQTASRLWFPLTNKFSYDVRGTARNLTTFLSISNPYWITIHIVLLPDQAFSYPESGIISPGHFQQNREQKLAAAPWKPLASFFKWQGTIWCMSLCQIISTLGQLIWIVLMNKHCLFKTQLQLTINFVFDLFCQMYLRTFLHVIN